MTNTEQLLKEIEQAPDHVIKEVLDFLLVTKAKSSENQATSPLLAFIDELNAQAPDDDMPTDFAKNVDTYLYGSSKT